MPIEMQAVKSSNIARLGYDPAEKTMRVQFSSGKSYDYKNVPSETFDKFRGAESVGGYFAKHIRPNFKGEPVEQRKD